MLVVGSEKKTYKLMRLINLNNSNSYFVYGISDEKYLIRIQLDWFIWCDKKDFKVIGLDDNYLTSIINNKDSFFSCCNENNIKIIPEFCIENLQNATRYEDDSYGDFFNGSHNTGQIWRAIFINKIVFKYENLTLNIGLPQWFDFNYRLGLLDGYLKKIADELTIFYGSFASFEVEVKPIYEQIEAIADYRIEDVPCNLFDCVDKLSHRNEIKTDNRILFLLISSLFSFSNLKSYQRLRRNEFGIIENYFEFIIVGEECKISLKIDQVLN